MRLDKRAADITVPEEGSLMTSRELANVLQISQQLVEDMRARGEGPKFMKIGERMNSPVRYRRDDVREWIESRIQIATREFA